MFYQVKTRYPLVGPNRVMNAPKEYYPASYDKNYDDNFTSKVELPETSFSCGDQKHFPGLYADEDLGCMATLSRLAISKDFSPELFSEQGDSFSCKSLQKFEICIQRQTILIEYNATNAGGICIFIAFKYIELLYFIRSYRTRKEKFSKAVNYRHQSGLIISNDC
ncbi:unnamed protein product [Nesidiocoris tenuis]|uniref:Uncharacterized protein n=1 Tax=Nesidiocoris tenuis TaxID=355587 RepID=A0A6H5HD63_9HEMI|nr:unnamed protein product [Nesidiocoris tenuis]CAB0011308.1 unnamed protein product [Nesidiocoris tenuis]